MSDHPGAQWRSLVRADGRSQAQIARAAGVSEKHLSQILTGRVMPSVSLVVRLSQTLDADPRELWLEQAEFALRRAQYEV